jgi:4-diphosphocytidyl-2-C-methyl-D-erythritol kinase
MSKELLSKSPIANYQSPIHKVKAPAKLNIRLKVIGRRPDGYHELVSIMVPVALFDYLELKKLTQKGITLTCEGIPTPCDKENLVYRAAKAFFASTGISGGVAITLTKNIPVAAGLGGGSSDAAGTLKCLNKMWSNPLGSQDLRGLALALGADVPFFIASRPSIARGIGEVLEPIEKWPGFWYVIVTPPIEVSTSWVYANLKLKLTIGEYDFILNCLKKEPIQIGHTLENDLESVTAIHFPVINSIKKLLLATGAVGALMSGSGPSVFGVFESRDKALLAKRSLVPHNMGDIFLAQGLS